MTAFDDDAEDMSRHRLINDGDAEAILGGSSPDAEFDELTQFLGRVKQVAAQPAPEMSFALSTLLSELSTPGRDEHALTGQAVERPRRRYRMPIQFAAGLSLAAKIALGAGLAAAGASAAAAAGVLPDPVQHAAAAVVRTVTPFEVPDTTGHSTTPPAPDNPTTTTNFGARVSSDAKGTTDGTHGVDGATISSEAKAKHDDKRCTNVPSSTTSSKATNDAATNDAATNDAATNDAATNDAATKSHPGCKPAADDSADAGAQDGHGKPAAPGQNGLDTAASTPAASHVPTSTPGGPPAAGTHPSKGREGRSVAPAIPPSVPAPPADNGERSPGTHGGETVPTPPSTPGSAHH